MSISEESYFTQWQVVSCSNKLDRVTGILAKPQAATREALERFEEKSEGEVATHSSSELPQQDSPQSCPILEEEGCHPWKKPSPQEIQR